MNIKTQLQCVHLLVFEHDEQSEYPYSIGGTGFIVKYNSFYFLITAKHCLANHQIAPEEISIVPHSLSRNFIPFDEISIPHPSDSQDWDYADFVILRIKHEMMTHTDLTNLVSFDLNENSVIVPGNPGIHAYVSRGFPKELSHVDYVERKISEKGLTFQPTYESPAIANHCHKFSMPPMDIDSLNGLSGSPIFAVINSSVGQILKLTGIAIKGGNHTITCIDAGILMQAFSQV